MCVPLRNTRARALEVEEFSQENLLHLFLEEGVQMDVAFLVFFNGF